MSRCHGRRVSASGELRNAEGVNWWDFSTTSALTLNLSYNRLCVYIRSEIPNII
jgi:hypothetical protein